MMGSIAECVTEPAFELVPLGLMRAGQSGRIGDVLGLGEFVHRLREMGLRDGAEVQMVRPGNPCLIRVGGQKLCIRADELASILIRRGALARC